MIMQILLIFLSAITILSFEDVREFLNYVYIHFHFKTKNREHSLHLINTETQLSSHSLKSFNKLLIKQVFICQVKDANFCLQMTDFITTQSPC